MDYKRIHFIKDKDEWILYYCDTVTYRKINEEEKNCCEYLLKGKTREEFYLAFPDADADLYKRCMADLTEDGRTAEQIPEEKLRLTLNTANACNMNCGYCYANGGTYHSAESLMSMETAKRAIDVFAGAFDEIGSVKFIGGEPLLNKKVVLGVCDYVREKYEAGVIKKMPDFIVVTNGTILDEEIIQYSVQYHWSVGLSFDGPIVHDLIRTFNNGASTTERIRENVRRWQEATGGRLPSSVNACYNGFHQKYGVSVTDAVKYIKEELGIQKVNMIPIDASSAEAYALSDNSCFVQAVKEILDPDSADYKKYQFTKMRQLEKILRSHLSMPPAVCQAGLTIFGVSAKGVISPCHLLTDENHYSMGTVFDDAVFDTEAFTAIQNKLRGYNRYENTHCKACFANRICPGCLGGNLFRTGDVACPDPVICAMVRGACEETVRDLVRNPGGE